MPLAHIYCLVDGFLMALLAFPQSFLQPSAHTLSAMPIMITLKLQYCVHDLFGGFAPRAVLLSATINFCLRLFAFLRAKTNGTIEQVRTAVQRLCANDPFN